MRGGNSRVHDSRGVRVCGPPAHDAQWQGGPQGPGALAAARKSAAPANFASATDLEATIARVWQDALGVDAVGSHDNFFDLGATSLIVAEVAMGLRQNCKLECASHRLVCLPHYQRAGGKTLRARRPQRSR